ncbi:related to beta-mannosidase [Phialocephala subalpina]|uniref:Beta-mannosidase B n=1 Tax=Phialocephala subalpina TaxID=576137 RepID=A0A1L7X7T3_9HELO|nr:related to beta-mannosidase [Phialocephala subalpina]
MPLQRIPITKNWTFKQSTTLNNSTASSFLPVAQFPTVAHIDLLHHGLIPDPYIDTNELDCLWVNDADWTYKTILPKLPELSGCGKERVVLVFDGLDTIVDVYFNGEKVLESRDMHLSHRVDVTSLLGKGENELELRFKNAPEYAKKEMKRIGYKGNGTDVHFGGPERLFVRKAQYHWGWDWGPAVNTSGPWKEVWVEVFKERIEEFLVRQEVSEDLASVVVKVTGKVEGRKEGAVVVEIKNSEGKSVLQQQVDVDENGEFKKDLKVEKPELWWPFSYGAQPLYTVSASIPGSHTESKTIGFRRLRLLQHSLKNAPGTSFTFEINNTLTPTRYHQWLSLAKSGNQAMIRVWGGGIVESDHFYQSCDELGILVWQDFLFACGDYPASDDFCELVKEEAEQQVKRVGHHASLAIWAGNNEDYMLAERWGWEYDPKDQEGPWDKTNFPARKIYERLLPDVCERLAGDVPYWRSSPYGGKTSNDVTVGDTHIWDVWHGKMSPFQDYKAYTSRFISEFGFESAPSLRALHKAITKPSERHWQSLTFDAHDKGPGHQRRYGMYSGENFRFRFNPLKDFVYCSQFLQAEAMKYAYNHWRREFRGPGEEICSGILVWQLNDIWPGTSWALVDVDWNLKASFYITKRALAKVVVGMERLTTSAIPYMVTMYPNLKRKLAIWAVNGYVKSLDAILKLSAFDIESGKKVELKEDERKVKLEGNQTTELLEVELGPLAEKIVIVAYLDTPSGERLARWVDWPEPLKFVHFNKKPNVHAKVLDGGKEVVLSAESPIKGIMLSVPMNEGGEDAKWGDNFIDLVPGEEVKVKVEGLEGRKVESRWLCDWENEEGFEL